MAPENIISTVPKKYLVIALPFLGKLSLQIRTRINRIMKYKLPYCNIRFAFQTKCKISNIFTFKDRIPSFSRPDIIYKFQCGGCNLPIMTKLNVILTSECVTFHCVKNVQKRSFFWSLFSFRIQSEYRKIRTRKNSIFGHF